MRIRVYKRGTSWYLDYRWNGRRLRYPAGEARKVADASAAAIQVQVAAGTFKGPMSEQPQPEARTVAELLEEWYKATKPKIRPATRESYCEIVKALRCWFGERWEADEDGGQFTGKSRLLTSITARDVERLYAERLSESKSGSAVRANRFLGLLRSAFRAGRRWGIVAADPTEGITKRREHSREADIRPEELYRRILPECEPWLSPIVVTAANTGARRGDLLGGRGRQALTWADVDMGSCNLTFRGTKEGKTRRVPINAELLSVLKELPSRFKGKDDPTAAVFSDRGGEPIKPDRAYRRFKAAAQRAGVLGAERLRFHDLRHAFGTNLAAEGVGAKEIQTLMGHSTLAMTSRYVHAREERLRDAVSRLSGTRWTQQAAADALGSAKNQS